MSEVTRVGEKRIFTLDEARKVLPVVRKITSEAVQRAEPLATRYDALPEDHEARPGLERELDEVVSKWGDKVTKLGAEAKGLWLVDFDNGEGYYCWRYPESEVDHYHDYDAGFDGRQQIN